MRMDISYSAQIYVRDLDVVSSDLTEKQLALLSRKGISGDNYTVVSLNAKLLPLATQTLNTNLTSIELISVISNVPVSVTVDGNTVVGDELIIKNTSQFDTGVLSITSLDELQIALVDVVVVGEL